MTGGNIGKLVWSKMVPVDSVLCRLVACFANSYERILIREIWCQNLKTDSTF